MLIGILSDSHDRYEMMAEAVRVLLERGAEFLIHCGDVGSANMLDHLAGVKSAFVFGNNDWDRAELERYAESIGIPYHGLALDLELDGKKIAVMHGDHTPRMESVLKAQTHDYLLHGHTHVKRDERVGKTRIINPGALHRAAVKTVALLDTAEDRVELIRVG